MISSWTFNHKFEIYLQNNIASLLEITNFLSKELYKSKSKKFKEKIPVIYNQIYKEYSNKSAHLEVDIVYLLLSGNKTKKEAVPFLKIKNASIYNNESLVSIEGNIRLEYELGCIGKFEVSMSHIEFLINKLFTKDFFITQEELYNIISNIVRNKIFNYKFDTTQVKVHYFNNKFYFNK